MRVFDCFAVSECGRGSDRNDDCAVLDADIGVFMVADGIGGRPGGDQASRAAAEGFLGHMRSLPPDSRVNDHSLCAAMNAANMWVLAIAEADPLLSGLGTTLCAAVLDGPRGKIAHVGDSRAYLLSGSRLRQLTKDHTLVAELVERRHVSALAASRHPLRHVLSRSLGKVGPAEPDIIDVQLEPGDWLLLATDGLSGVFSISDLERVLAGEDLQTAEKLCRAVSAAAAEACPEDDSTIAAVKLAVVGGGTDER